MQIRQLATLLGTASLLLFPAVQALDLAGEKLCYDSATPVPTRCVYVDHANEDGVICLVGTDDADNATQAAAIEACLRGDFASMDLANLGASEAACYSSSNDRVSTRCVYVADHNEDGILCYVGMDDGDNETTGTGSGAFNPELCLSDS